MLTHAAINYLIADGCEHDAKYVLTPASGLASRTGLSKRGVLLPMRPALPRPGRGTQCLKFGFHILRRTRRRLSCTRTQGVPRSPKLLWVRRAFSSLVVLLPGGVSEALRDSHRRSPHVSMYTIVTHSPVVIEWHGVAFPSAPGRASIGADGTAPQKA